VRNCLAGPKTFVYIGVANLGDFPHKKSKFGDYMKNGLGIF
jgi:hypothetical protein